MPSLDAVSVAFALLAGMLRLILHYCLTSLSSSCLPRLGSSVCRLHGVVFSVAWVCSQVFSSAKAFNQDIAGWNTARVTTMASVCSLPLHARGLIARGGVVNNEP